MQLQKKILIPLALLTVFNSCELLEPENDNHNTFERAYEYPIYAEGLLINAYTNIPTNNFSYLDVATDNAVTNDKFSDYLRMATGEWSSKNNPVNQWDNCLESIIYINKFLNEVVDSVQWKWSDDEMDILYRKRFTGEAYALRALFQYHLLVTIAGVGYNNELLGIPIYETFPETFEEFNIPRASFSASVEHIYSDIEKALEYLTMDEYVDVSSPEELPEGYEDVDITKYNDIFGIETNQRINGRFAKALRARVALLAASPAFSDGDQALWAAAANYAAEVLISNGGLSGLDPVGNRFYEGSVIDEVNLLFGGDQKEIILRTAITNSNTRELANFPPSLFGNGEINPTQNLVDAFPMKSGYPIAHPSSGYNPEDPYSNRDPRLALYIIYNGSIMKDQEIITGVGGGVNAKDSINNSTRTGYYLKKMLVEEVNVEPNVFTTKKHYNVHMRYTELFLIYAEAANEAWGPDGTGENSFSARDVILAIRDRGGINGDRDDFMISVSTKEDMREVIRNERRIELCFEGFRFWDLRRWKMDLGETARGVNIDQEGSYEYVDVEERPYNNGYMHYGPLPENDVLNFSALIQNTGW